MAATVWTLGAISFNSGADADGVYWWADIPTGWHTPRSPAKVVNRAGVNGGLIFGARKAPRTLQITAEVIAPDQTDATEARNALETLVDGLITTAADLTVVELGGAKKLSVRYLDGLNVTVRTAVSFSFQLPLVALSPTKVAV